MNFKLDEFRYLVSEINIAPESPIFHVKTWSSLISNGKFVFGSLSFLKTCSAGFHKNNEIMFLQFR